MPGLVAVLIICWVLVQLSVPPWPVGAARRPTYNLSRKLSRAVMPSFRHLCLWLLDIKWLRWLVFSKDSPNRIYQQSDMPWRKAWPLVRVLRSAATPKGSLSARQDFITNRGFPATWLSSDVALLPVQDTTDITNHLFQTRNRHMVNELPEIGHSNQYGGIEAAQEQGDLLSHDG